MTEAASQNPVHAAALRRMTPEDRDWVVDRHGALYSDLFGWGEDFRAVVAAICDEFLLRPDSEDERGWIAEIAGRPAGCIAMCRRSDEEAQLRLLIVDESARGRGVGRLLVERCVGHARRRGYKRMVLWTNAELTGARRLYASAGFRPVEAEVVEQFGSRWVSEIWRLEF
ncbi:GNAT family N-acetyltransferase [Altererythrobacter soli]|uniref:GNAT family N-acetyltransferase n=1 Tax=Croceibacterium soli TaxID=1739690 RepID=A0A6I4UUP5_9SPHN|nr:GNAT family N-acetyltransferase [Croceibacterium soli]MXP41207.1 GNAT family N-acetyltransferase [Croceibacterium soli]